MEEIYSPKLRLQATHDGPLRGGERYRFGFYDAGILREILNHLGSGDYKVWTLPIPRDEKQFQYAVSLVNNPKVQYALVDKNKIVFVVVQESSGWMSAMTELGYQVHSGDKTNKRLKSAHRPTLLNAHFDNLNIRYVESTDYSRYDFSNPNADNGVAPWLATPEAQARLLDGGFVISRRIIQESVKNIPFHLSYENMEDHDYYYDPRIYQQMVQDLLNSTVVNARLVFSDGFLKGNAFVADLPEGIDVLTSRENIKKEITYSKGYRFLAEPQGPKSRVITDDQTVINLPKLFRKSDMEMWLSEEYKKMFNKATSGDLLTNWKYIYQRKWQDSKTDNVTDVAEEHEARARMAYVGYRWTAAGFDVTQSPWLFETVSISHAKPLQTKIVIPCSVYEQIIPESLARMAGYDLEVEEDTIVRCNELGCHVVNDLNWLEMYESHGGMDEDDFFKLFYRTMQGGDYDGEKVVIAVRSPNGYGEYTIFRYVEGSWAPTWHKADGTPVMFPEVNGRGWPVRLSSQIFRDQIKYSGLPSESQPKVKRTGPYTQEDVIRDIKIAMTGGNVGGYVNASMAHSMVIGKHRPVQLCTLETAIDKCINPDNAADVLAIDSEADKMMREVIKSGKPIDNDFWYKRGMKRFLKRGETVELYNGKISQLNSLCDIYFKRYVNSIRDWSHKNARPHEIIHQLGNRLRHHAYPVLRQFRMNLYNTNSTEVTKSSGAIQRSSWENLYSDIVDKIKSYERLVDSYDFVIALYSESIKNPTSSGKITDQIVMNRFVFPYLEEALQYYGVALTVKRELKDDRMRIVSDRVTSWVWTDSEGNSTEYTDPLEFQRAHSESSPIIFVSPKPQPRYLAKSLH